jgi:uncharacterized phage protein (TIGR01671 family)
MRTIKYRAKVKNGYVWIYGSLLQSKDGKVSTLCHIETVNEPFNKVLANPDTVQQFTSCYDGNGKEIYEGDILEHPVNRRRHVVRYSEEYSAFVARNLETDAVVYLWCLNPRSRTVIGNIFDNPVLIEKKYETKDKKSKL